MPSSRRSPSLCAASMVVVFALGLAGCTGDDAPAVQVEQVSAGEVTQTVSAPASVEAAA